MDYTGEHIIIAMSNGENYYMHTLLKKPKLLVRMRDMVITAVAWNRQVSEGDESTKEILIGTSKGRLSLYGVAYKGEGRAFLKTPSQRQDVVLKHCGCTRTTVDQQVIYTR